MRTYSSSVALSTNPTPRTVCRSFIGNGSSILRRIRAICTSITLSRDVWRTVVFHTSRATRIPFCPVIAHSRPCRQRFTENWHANGKCQKEFRIPSGRFMLSFREGKNMFAKAGPFLDDPLRQLPTPLPKSSPEPLTDCPLGGQRVCIV